MCKATRDKSRCRCRSVFKLAKRIQEKHGNYGFIDVALQLYKKEEHFRPGYAARIETIAGKAGETTENRE